MRAISAVNLFEALESHRPIRHCRQTVSPFIFPYIAFSSVKALFSGQKEVPTSVQQARLLVPYSHPNLYACSIRASPHLPALCPETYFCMPPLFINSLCTSFRCYSQVSGSWYLLFRTSMSSHSRLCPILAACSLDLVGM